MRTLRNLAEDGLESLGTIQLGHHGRRRRSGGARHSGRERIVVRRGDPSGDLAPVRPSVVPRSRSAGGADPRFTRPASTSFYDLYDEAQEAATLELPRGRLVVLDGGLRTDADVLKSTIEVEELPWVLDRGVVVGGLEEWPATVIVPQDAARSCCCRSASGTPRGSRRRIR